MSEETTTTPHRVWRFGADVDTDQLAPGIYMKLGIEGIAPHCLEGVRPEFAATVRPGDVIAAGPNFASARRANRPPPRSCTWGEGGDRAFLQRAVLPQRLQPRPAAAHLPRGEQLAEGESVQLDLQRMQVVTADGRHLACDPIPGFLLDMVDAGGLLNQLRRKLASSR